MTDEQRAEDETFASFDGMTWPVPGVRLDELNYTLRHGVPTRSDLLLAASVLSAYRQMVSDPVRKREVVVRRLREAMGK